MSAGGRSGNPLAPHDIQVLEVVDIAQMALAQAAALTGVLSILDDHGRDIDFEDVRTTAGVVGEKIAVAQKQIKNLDAIRVSLFRPRAA